MRPTIAARLRRVASRPRAVVRRPAAPQRSQLLATIGVITMLMLAWGGMVSTWPGLH
jgi:hypothetical protein